MSETSGDRALMRAIRTAILVLFLAPAIGLAQVQPPPSMPADAAVRAAIIDSVTAALNRTYVFPEVATAMEQHVRSRAADGAYDGVTTIDAFAGVLTRELQSISHDRHLRIGYLPPATLARLSADRDTAAVERQRRAALQRNNFAFRKIELLAGNVGYLRLDGFINTEYSGPTAIAAMNFLAHADALIVDLRYNGGGSPSLIQLISSYFFDEPEHLNSFYVRETDETQQFWTQTHVSGPRMTDTPIYVLTSDRTFSAAEEFTYNLKHMERGTIVGDTTGGGAHPVNQVVFESLNVGMALPFGRAVNPVTGTNWEGVGVIPHVAVEADAALEMAHLLALRAIGEETTDERRAFAVDWAIAGLEARMNPTTVAADVLESYAGRYGPRSLRFEDGQLWYQREGGQQRRAIPMSERLFRFEELAYFRLEVVIDPSGRPLKLVGHYDDGSTDESERSAGG